MSYSYFAFEEDIFGHMEFRIDILDVPTKRFALQPFAYLLLLAHIAKVAEFVVEALVDKVFVFVEPHLGYSYRVSFNNVSFARHCVRHEFSEHVAHTTAGNSQQATAAHPNLIAKKKLEILISI